MLRYRMRPMSLVILIALALTLWLRPGPAAAVPAQAPQGFTAYLPFVTTAPSSTPSPPSPPQTDAPAGMFAEPERKTGRTSLAIDGQGGTHMAYRYNVPAAEHPQLVYAYRPPPAAQCAQPERWSRVAMLDRIEDVQLELTPAGAPRILALMRSEDGSVAFYAYLECDEACTREESWRGIGVQTQSDVLGEVVNYDTPRRSFELDPQGRPRFVYYDESRAEGHVGGFYLWCDASCTEEGTWNEVRFTRELAGPYGTAHESVGQPVLKFTRDGNPRILALLNPLGNGEPGQELRFDVYYFACDSGCEESEQWERARVAERGSGYEPAWDLALDPATDSPRAVSYQSGERRLWYHSCESDCLAAGQWRSTLLREDGWGGGADLLLDPQGRPYLAVLNTGLGAGAMTCGGDCHDGARWSLQPAEGLGDLEAAYPVARPVTCNDGFWYVSAPTVAADPQGKRYVAYEAAYQAKCQYVDPTLPAPPTDVFHEIWHAVRYAAMP